MSEGEAQSERSPSYSIDPRTLELLVCPLTKDQLKFDAETNELISERAKLAYPIRDGVAIMLVSEARSIE